MISSVLTRRQEALYQRDVIAAYQQDGRDCIGLWTRGPTYLQCWCISCSAVSIRGRGCAARPAVSYRDRDERSRAECETASAPKIEISKGTSKRESGYSLEAMMSKRSRPIRHPPIDPRDRSRTLSRMASVSAWSRTKTFILLVDRCSPPLSHLLVVVPIPCVCYSWQREVSSFPPNEGLMGPSVSPGPPWASNHAWVTALPKGDPLTAVQRATLY